MVLDRGERWGTCVVGIQAVIASGACVKAGAVGAACTTAAPGPCCMPLGQTAAGEGR